MTLTTQRASPTIREGASNPIQTKDLLKRQQRQPRLLQRLRRRLQGAPTDAAVLSETTTSTATTNSQSSCDCSSLRHGQNTNRHSGATPLTTTTTTTTAMTSEADDPQDLKRTATEETDSSSSSSVDGSSSSTDGNVIPPAEAKSELAPQSKVERELERLQRIIQEEGLSTIEQVNLLYALGRLSAKVGKYEQALEYHQAEYEMTQQLVDEVGGSTDALARVLDGMAKIALKGLADHSLAHDCYKSALAIRKNLYQNVAHECRSCQVCSSTGYTCHGHAQQLHELKLEMHENQRNIGRVLFEEGHVTRAVQMIPSIGDFE